LIEVPDNAQSQMRLRQFKTGLWLCWLSFLALPLGLLAIGGGPCAGPRNGLGSLILLTVGAFGVGGGLFGMTRVFRAFKAAKNLLRAGGILSVIVAGFAFLVGGVYLFIGYESLQVFLRY
jgi:hypothetical protein